MSKKKKKNSYLSGGHKAHDGDQDADVVQAQLTEAIVEVAGGAALGQQRERSH